MKDSAKKQKAAASDPLAGSPSVEGAPRDATQTGRSPEPENKHAKRYATKRRLSKATDDRKGGTVLGRPPLFVD
jgi:hypothetical protein